MFTTKVESIHIILNQLKTSQRETMIRFKIV